jgi:hypothetical protein
VVLAAIVVTSLVVGVSLMEHVFMLMIMMIEGLNVGLLRIMKQVILVGAEGVGEVVHTGDLGSVRKRSEVKWMERRSQNRVLKL